MGRDGSWHDDRAGQRGSLCQSTHQGIGTLLRPAGETIGPMTSSSTTVSGRVRPSVQRSGRPGEPEVRNRVVEADQGGSEEMLTPMEYAALRRAIARQPEPAPVP